MSVNFDPLVSNTLLVAITLTIITLCLISAILYKRGLIGRSICAAAFMAVLINPSIVEKQREAVKDVAVIIADRSPSQDNGMRKERTDAALEYFKTKLGNKDNLELRIIETPNEDALTTDTRLFEELDKRLSDVPANRRAGVIIISDGQIHDIPEEQERLNSYGPIHLMLTGDKNEKDRQIVITEAPSYGIVGQNITIRYRINDTDNINKEYATLLVRANNLPSKYSLVPVNKEQTLEIMIDHTGQNIIDIETDTLDDEITSANNRIPIIINGVRERLRVLLVSGKPHAGGRTWRDILTSDPGVDLVHFTILREPNKLDTTPQRELSLIAFPFKELFETKLYDFDLIIFDRYRLNRIMPSYYFDNIAKYVQEGGAFLEVSGPSFAGKNSIYTTALQDILPAYPTGKVIVEKFYPYITTIGKNHPVTQDLAWNNNTYSNVEWGPLLRQVSVEAKQGDTLMTGASNSPLLILSHSGKGRVAQLASDQIWLWERGFEGGGPQAELLRRLSHWLMKEPELDENALKVVIEDSKLKIQRRSLQQNEMPVTITSPTGSEETLTLKPSENGWLQVEIDAKELGVYVVKDNKNTRFVIAGNGTPPELSGVISTAVPMQTAINTTKGSTRWIVNEAKPAIRFLPPNRNNYSGSNWLGLRKNSSFNITDVKDKPLLPDWAYALMLLTAMIFAWWFEGKKL